jgi:hypothetical protein
LAPSSLTPTALGSSGIGLGGLGIGTGLVGLVGVEIGDENVSPTLGIALLINPRQKSKIAHHRRTLISVTL